ncbi:MAG TPA: multicopper oxidase domain-containing protein [Chthoniobacterales bacterium]|nr:multicopper oxidase domain-containing protein [Chthoniobacterales bacterium]
MTSRQHALPIAFYVQILPKLTVAIFGWAASIGLLVAASNGQDRIVPELPEASSPVTIVAASDPVTGKSEFRYRGNNTPPVIRVQPGSILKVEYKNELAAQSKEDCVGHPCMQMTNLHFHGLHVSPNAPQDDVLDMMASPGETLHYSVEVPPQQPPGLYWYHTHSHGESYVQDLDGMSGAIVVEGIERYVPEVLKMRERILVLRDLVLPTDAAERKSVMASVAMQTTQCGTAAEKPERAFTVNGTLRPKIDIAPGERQFWRIVNASPDLYADLELDSASLEVVALDGMPLAYHDPSIRKRSMSHVLVPPAGRVESIVTGPPADSHAVLRSRCFDTGPDGDSNPAMVLADIVSPPPSSLEARPALGGSPIYATFSPKIVTRAEASEPQFVVNFTEDKQGFYINGQKFEMNSGPMLTVDVGSLQHWRVTNSTKEVHPFHIHQVHFLAYAIDEKPVKDPVWLDTVNVPYGSSVDLVMDFTDPIIRGMSLFHCHLLKHEDKGMMAKILFR